MEIRIANIQDLMEIDEIYNQAISSGFQTGDLVPWTYHKRLEWFNEHCPKTHPIFVAIEAERVIGFVSASPYRKGRGALSKTIEVSVFVHNQKLNRGIGSSLIAHMGHTASRIGYKTIIAIVLDTNLNSIYMFEKMGYSKWGVLPCVAEFGDVEVGHIYFGKKIEGCQK